MCKISFCNPAFFNIFHPRSEIELRSQQPIAFTATKTTRSCCPLLPSPSCSACTTGGTPQRPKGFLSPKLITNSKYKCFHQLIFSRKQIRVSNIFVHENFSDASKWHSSHDIALLKLGKGQSIHYVIQIWVPRETPPLHNIVINWEGPAVCSIEINLDDPPKKYYKNLSHKPTPATLGPSSLPAYCHLFGYFGQSVSKTYFLVVSYFFFAKFGLASSNFGYDFWA